MINQGVQETTNYLVPSSGGTHAVPVSGIFSATAYLIDWRQFAIDQFAFQPQGVFVDNSQGNDDLTITIEPIGWRVVVPKGAQSSANFPAPNGQTASIVGDGQASVIFVDFPVLPAGTVVTVSGTADVNIVSPDPLPTSPTVNASGVPYQNTEVPVLTAANYSGAITGSTKTVTITPGTANQYLRKLILSFTGNASTAAAGTNLLTVTLNGVTIYEENVYLPGAAGTVTGSAYKIDLDFAKLGLYAAAGDLVVTLVTALANGLLDVNAYFA